MVTPTKILRTNRRSLSLTIAKDGSLIVRAPKRLSMDYIYSFIKQKEKWILTKQRQIENNHIVNESIYTYDELLFCGKKYKKVEVDGLKKVELSGNSIFVPAGLEKQKQIKLLLKWYVSVTKEILKERIVYFSNLMQRDYNIIKLDNSKTKWGSCDNKNNLNFNLRLSMLPHKVIDYIVIHELSHIVEFNHSKKFYAIIESVMPDYKKNRALLKQHNYLLQLLR